MMEDQVGPVINEPVNIKRLPKRGTTFRLDVEVTIRQELAIRLELLEIEALDLMAAVKPWHRGGVEISGTIGARYTQPCAVTGDPLPQEMSEQFKIRMVPEGSRLARPVVDGEGEMALDPEGDDPPDTFSGDVINLGAVWEEFFTLSIDPFARKDGALLEKPDSGADEAGNDTASPFAELAKLKKH